MRHSACTVFLNVTILAMIPIAAEADSLQGVLETTMGDIRMELYDAERPITVENFVTYVNEGFYDGEDGLGATIFHRVIEDFVIQGGGYTVDLLRKDTHEPIVNEADGTYSNVRATIAMARTIDPHSATSQFFINVVDNPFLDYQDPGNPGYAVFGHVVEGMDVVDAIASVDTHSQGGHSDVPVDPIIIRDAYIVPEPGTLSLLFYSIVTLRRRR